MEPIPAFKFKSIEEDIGIGVKSVWEDLKKVTANPTWMMAFDTMMPLLLEAYTAKGKLDDLINWVVIQCGDSDNELSIQRISDRLVELKDRDRLVRMWSTVSAMRKSAGLDERAKSAQLKLADALSSIGDAQGSEEIRERLVQTQGGTQDLPEPLSASMTETLFWQIIDNVKQRSASVYERPQILTEELKMLSGNAIKQFAVLLQNKLADLYSWDLWAVAYIARGGCGDDAFEYFRAWIISEGQEIYDRAMTDPGGTADFIVPGSDLQLEAMLYSPYDAYLARVGERLQIPRQRRRMPHGKNWREKDLPRLYPKVWAKFN